MLFKLLFKCSPRWQRWLIHRGLNWFPAYRNAGGRVVSLSDDLMRMRVKLHLTRRTKNVHGALFGGALFSLTDGPHPVLLMCLLGKDFIAWDKASSIRFRRPAFGDVYGDCYISPEDLQWIRAQIAEKGETERTFTIEIKDKGGDVCAVVDRTIYLAHKDHYHQKRTNKTSAI